MHISTPAGGDTSPPPEPADAALALTWADPAQARALAQQALAAAEQQADPSGRILPTLALALIDLRSADLAPAHRRLQQAEVWLRAHPNARCSALARHGHALMLRHQGDQAQAVAILTELHGHAKARPVLDAFHTLMALGTAQGMSDQWEQSLASYFEGLELARRSGLPSLEVNALNNLGSLQQDLYNLDDAVPLLRRSLAGALAIGSRRQTIFAAGNLALCLCEMGQAQEALVLARTHLIGLIREDDPPSLQRDEEIAHALLENGLCDEARLVLGRAPAEDVQTNSISAYRAWLQARLLLADGREADALAHCLASQALAQEDSTTPVDRVRLAEITAEAARRRAEWRTAFEHQHQAYVQKDQLLGRAAKARYLSLQIDHDLRSAREELDAARRLAAQLEALALEDPLTGLANRRHLFQAGREVLGQACPGAGVVCVALIDLDHFKLVNDRHGHETGDRVLTTFADLLRTCFRSDDICARYGGEEFALVLPATTPAIAAERLAHLQSQLRGVRFVGAQGAEFNCSFSAGIAWSLAEPVPLERLLQQADDALYRAKAGGRSRVELAEVLPLPA
ncbi:diguanylate cyclase (GGDEF) domain-containing protein [Burkholderiales bacterium JOSHI_001]|nr:diguanylate cyclase (GGDEF) domain-containing protein [Burkholderiales bacterium JOSHI_001]